MGCGTSKVVDEAVTDAAAPTVPANVDLEKVRIPQKPNQEGRLVTGVQLLAGMNQHLCTCTDTANRI